MKNKKNKTVVKVLIGLMVIFVGVFYFTNQSSSNQVKAENLSTTTLLKKTLENTVSSSGNVASSTSISLSSSLNTTMIKLNVQVGDSVSKGDVLAQFDTKELDKDIDSAQYTYNNAKALYDMKVINAWDKLDTEKRRYAGAYQEGSVDWQYVYNDAINWDDKVKAAQNEYDTLRLNDTTTNYKSQLDDLLQKKKDATLKSPIDGVITNVNGSVGNVSTGTVIVIQDIENLVVNASIPGYDVIKLSTGLDVIVNLNDVDGEFNGQIIKVSPIANTNGDYDLTVKLTDDTTNLRIGMDATIRIVVDRKENIYVVPLDSIIEENGKYYVVAYDSTLDTVNQKNEIEVTLGMETDFYVEVNSSELKDGLEILNDPLNKYIETDPNVVNGPFGGSQ